MKSLCLFSLFLFSQLAHAGDSDSDKTFFQKIVDVISRINTGKVITPPELSCSEDQKTPVKFVSSLFNKCAVDICGPAKDNVSVWITNDNFSKNIPQETLERIKKLNPTLERLFTHAQKVKMKEKEELRQFFQKASQNLDHIPPDLDETMARDIFSPYISLKIDPLAAPEKRFIVTAEAPEQASPDFIKALKNYSEKIATTIPLDTRSVEFQRAYKENENYLPLAKKYFERVEAMYKKNQKSVTSDLSSSFKTLNSLLAEKALTKLNYDRVIMQIRYIDDTLALEAKTKSLTRATCDAPECKKSYQEFFKSSQLTKSFKFYENAVSSSRHKANAINRCKAMLISKNMMTAEDKKAREVFLKSRETILQNFLPRFSTHSREIMSKYLNEKLIVSGIDIRKKVSPPVDAIESFNDDAAYYTEVHLLNLKIPDAQKWKKLSDIYSNNGDVNPYSDVLPCIGSGQVSWDAYLPVQSIDLSNPQLSLLKDLSKGDHVFVSDHSCENHLHGKHNTSHEIGHALNSLFKTTPLSTESLALYKDFRACANTYYPKAPPATHGLSHHGDSLFTEEDVADLIAIASNPKDKKIYSCQFFRSNLAGDAYEDLSFIDDEGMHSTGLSRSIIEMINKGIPIPASCQDLIKEERPDINLKKCL